MKKLIVLFAMCFMAAIATVQAQNVVEVNSTTDLELRLLRRNVVHTVFSKLTNKDYKSMKVKAECKDMITDSVSMLFRKDLALWVLVEKLNARKGTYKKYAFKFDGAINFSEQLLYADSTTKIPAGIPRSYKKGFGKFTQDLARKRINNSYGSLIKDDVLKKYMKRTIRLMTKLTTKDICKKMIRRKKL